MVNETILAIIIAFAISAALCPVIIPFLHRLKFGQQVRDDGPQSHLKKQGTPTMGGLIILTAIVITSLFYIKSYPRIIPILFVTVGFGIIGFLDDYIKIVMKRSEGLNPIQKLIGQFIITGIFTYYLMTSGEVGTGMLIPFTGGFENGYYLNLGWLFIPAVFFIVLGTDNGVNFTDGLDGLCTSVTILVATFFTVVAIGENSGIWYNAVVRGDRDSIVIGRESNIQDNAVVHLGSGYPVEIGDHVTIGHGAIVHGCKIGDNTMIGMGAILMNGCKIGKNCIIGAGALVTQNVEIPDNSLVIGNPGKVKRAVTEEEVRWNLENAQLYVDEAQEEIKRAFP